MPDNTLWILKPAALSQGRGIRLVNNRTNISNISNYIVSKYIMYPHLINSYKYDLRVYVGVVSFEPLVIYMFKNGIP